MTMTYEEWQEAADRWSANGDPEAYLPISPLWKDTPEAWDHHLAGLRQCLRARLAREEPGYVTLPGFSLDGIVPEGQRDAPLAQGSKMSTDQDMIDMAWAAQEQVLIDQATHSIHVQMLAARAGHRNDLVPLVRKVVVLLEIEYLTAKKES